MASASAHSGSRGVDDVSSNRKDLVHLTAPSPVLVDFLRRHTIPGELLQAHGDDGTGHCSVCSAGGQTGRLTWPCYIWHAAHDAARPG